MGIFVITGVAFVVGIILILLLKNTSPPPPKEQIHFDSPEDMPLFLRDQEAFKQKCLDFLYKFNLDYRHSVWANDKEKHNKHFCEQIEYGSNETE